MGDIKKNKSFKKHNLSLPKEGSEKSKRWFSKREEEIRKKEIKNELRKEGIDMSKAPKFIVRDGVPHKIVDGKLVPLKKL